MDTIRIVHCSDPHFGSPNQDAAWTSFRDDVNQKVKPHLVLITGDLVHTTSEALYAAAERELSHLQAVGRPVNDAYRVCAGNHDRHPLGNAPGPLNTLWEKVAGFRGAPAWFDNAFTGRIPTVAQPSDIELSSGQNKWVVRIIGIDTSINAKFTALGYAKEEDIRGLAAAAAHEAADLVIVMHHHHLVPIRELEEARQTFGQVFRPTIMLNAGTVLEALARGSINIVLHGHEHHRAASRYGTLHGEQTDTVVLGAGSATGNDSYKGCDLRRASYNVIELRQDKSVCVQERVHDGVGWGAKGNPVQLLDSRAIRRARFFRRAGPAAPPTSKITKCVEFHSDRSIDVHQTWTDWELKDGRWGNSASNSSGVLSEARVRFDWLDGVPEEHNDLRYSPHPASDHTYRAAVILRGGARRAKHISLRFRWIGGGVLTRSDLEFLDPMQRGMFRSAGKEFSAFRVMSNELRSVSLLIRLPAMFAPRPEQVEVLFAAKNADYEVSADLRAGLQHHAPGLFSLEIQYPLPNFRYALAWPLADAPRVSAAAQRFHRSAGDGGGAGLLDAFADSVRQHPAVGSATLGLYIPGKHPDALQRAAKRDMGNADGHSAPEFLALGGDNLLNRHAWWGQIQRAVADPGKHNSAFMPGERALAIVPIRQFGRENEASWGLVRLGIHAGQGVDDDALLQQLAQHQMYEALADGVLSVLQRSSQGG